MKSLEKWSVASLIRIMVKVSQGKRISSSVMAIIVNVDVMLAKRKISLTKLSEEVGVTISNLSILKTGKAKAIRFSTLEAICEPLNCQPGDILEYRESE